MNLKGLSGGGREIKLDFYNQKAIKTCRNPCKILGVLGWGGCTVAKHFQRILQTVRCLLGSDWSEVFKAFDWLFPCTF